MSRRVCYSLQKDKNSYSWGYSVVCFVFLMLLQSSAAVDWSAADRNSTADECRQRISQAVRNQRRGVSHKLRLSYVHVHFASACQDVSCGV